MEQGKVKLENQVYEDLQSNLLNLQFPDFYKSCSKEDLCSIKIIEKFREKLDREKREIFLGEDQHYTKICESSRNSVSLAKGIVLFTIARKIKPRFCLELGTNLGVSASYINAALQLNKKGKLITIELRKELAKEASRNLKYLGCKRVSVFNGILKDFLSRIPSKNILFDLVFIDFYHREKPTLEYFSMLIPFLSQSSILVFDDIFLSNEMQKAWRAIKRNKNIKSAFEVFKLGICFISRYD